MYLTDQELTQIREFFRTKPVQKAYLFGSYARGEADEQSDVDLLVDIDEAQHVGLDFFGWPVLLERILLKRVDLGSSDSILPFYKSFIEADKLLIYDQEVWRQTAA